MNRQHEKKIWFIPLLKQIPLFFALIFAVSFPVYAGSFELLLGTGEPKTFSHFTGRTLSRLVEKNLDTVKCKTVTGADDVHNLTNLQGGSLDLVLIDSRILHDALNKSGDFKFLDIRYDNLRALVSLYEVPVTLVVRGDADITALDAVKGKRINAGAPSSSEHFAVDTILQAKGWSMDDFSLVQELSSSKSEDTMAFCHGTVQAMIHIGVHPNPSLQQLIKLCKANMVSMDDADIQKMVEKQPAFLNIDIASGTYPAIKEKISTFGTRVMLVASEDLDDETVNQILQVIFDNQKRLKSAHPALFPTRVKPGEKAFAGVPLHTGATQFFSK
jgi:TRAP transporter TAXI family solute receptor